jgi:tetratricopeptide (TPR) repeat protein
MSYYNRGNAYRKLSQYQQAVEDYNEAILLQPDYVLAYTNRGGVYFNQGNDKLGCRDAQKACELGNCTALIWTKGKGLCR